MAEEMSRLMRLALSGSTEDELRQELTHTRDRMVRLLGQRKARQIWRDLSPVKPGRIAGERTYRDAAPLVDLYDELRSSEAYKHLSPTKTREEIGKFVHETRRFLYGSTAAGIAKTLGRALQSREQQKRREEMANAAIRRNMLVALLGSDKKPPE